MTSKEKIEDLERRSKKALKNAVSALYFNDNSDFVGLFHEIILHLSGIEEYANEEEIKQLYKDLNSKSEIQEQTKVLSKELFDLIQKHVPNDGSFESKLLSMEVGKEYNLSYIQLAIDVCSNSY